MASHPFSYDASVVQRAANSTFSPAVIDRFARAATQALGAPPDREQLAAHISQFDLIWDAAGNILPNAVSRYSKRVAAVPAKAAKRWAVMSLREPLAAVFSLAALEGLWHGDAFGEHAFDRLVDRHR